jgi:lipopolysaccharide/colanic/teichoic acid biosynthesis glycosyltransferase
MAKTGVEYLNSSSKRKLDIAGSMALGALASPLAVPTAIAAGVDNGSKNIIFKQVREGQRGPVRISKFRTIREELTRGPEISYGTYDPRASVIGNFLRKWGVDEIPQLVSVLSGDMALIGPRLTTVSSIAEKECLAPQLFPEWEEAYRSSKPGLIDPSRFYLRQQTELTDSAIVEIMKMEIAYVRNASLVGDLRFLGSLPIKLLGLSIRRAPSSVSDTELSLEVDTEAV